MNYEPNDFDSPARPGLMSIVLPLVTAGASGVFGLALGILGTLLVSSNEPVPPTAAQTAAACAPEVQEKQAEVVAAQNEVQRLSTEVEVREAKVVALETEMGRRSERGRAVSRELSAAKAELAAAREELAVAYSEQERLRTELTATVEKLEETEVALTQQTRLTDLATDDALTNRWARFLNDAQLEICEKGNRKRLGECREIVEAKVGSNRVQNAFEHCVRAKAATPSVVELARDAALPRHANFVDQEDRVVAGWFVQFCDPTLPEADFFSDPAAAHASVLDMGLDD